MVASVDGHRAPDVHVLCSSYLLSSPSLACSWQRMILLSRLDLQAKSDTSSLFKELCSLCASLQLYEVPFNLAPVEPQPAQCFYEQSWQSSCCTCMAGHSYSHSMCMCLRSANRSNAFFFLFFSWSILSREDELTGVVRKQAKLFDYCFFNFRISTAVWAWFVSL